ncbi:hypothetical protein GIB67_014937 [Kingdonia uniflora]|uniref:CCR4-NOT transcription complex subunit 10 n=1 Tax=Kingdonia uniflora TaxID=39325 RepID=A0A7J7MTF2_9MAGN|nr:hypothetical protein GIB67_014937 [Kingdonia uniflora]
MDLRDLSSSSSSLLAAATTTTVVTGTREVSSSDEDLALPVTTVIAKEAFLLFQSRRFGECLDVLMNQLLHKKEDDPKVLHNIAVAEYFCDGCSDPRKLLEVLNKVKKRSEDLARAAGEQGDSGGNLVISGSKGSMSNQFPATNVTRIAYSDEYDTCVTMLNIAVVMFHLHEYANASAILEPLYQNIEPIEETTALHICLLLLDVALATHDVKRAADVIQYLEKAFGVGYMMGQTDNGSTGQHQASNLPIKTSSAPSNPTLAISNTENASEIPLTRTYSDDTLDYENLLSTLGPNVTRLPGVPSTNDLARIPVPAVDLKLKLHLYKVRLLLLTGNLKAAKREVKLAVNIARGRDSSTALLLKSQLEFARGNHRKSIKLLMTSSSNRTDPGISVIFNNNFGCIYHQLVKHHTSTLFFSKALKTSSNFRSEKPLKLSTFSQDKSLLIVYNCGLQYLVCGKPLVAARCLLKARLMFDKKSLFWLRLAECCLLALEKEVLSGEEVRAHVVGNGKWRQLLVENGKPRNKNLDLLQEDDTFLDVNGQPKLSMLFARQCLLKALDILNINEQKSSKEESESTQLGSFSNSNLKNMIGGDSKVFNATVLSVNGDIKDSKGGMSANTILQSSISAYEDNCRRANKVIQQAILADMAFVELELENPLKALSAAKALLKLPECSKIYLFLGHVYAAEALCFLNQPKEAAGHLLVYMSDENNFELPFSQEDREKCRVERSGEGEESSGLFAGANYKKPPLEESQDISFLSPEEARGSLYVNLATMCGIQGDLEQAHLFATKALSTIPNNPRAVLTAVYVDLLLGKVNEALVMLKSCSRLRFVPTGVTTNNN